MSQIENEDFESITVKTENDLIEPDTYIGRRKDLNLQIVDSIKEEIITENDSTDKLLPTSIEIKAENVDAKDTPVCRDKVKKCKSNQIVLNTFLNPKKCAVVATSTAENCECPFHTEEVSLLEPYSCGKCKFTTNDSKIMSRHMLDHNKRSQTITQAEKPQIINPETIIIDEDEPDDPRVMYRCPFCGFRSPVKELMTKHYIEMHDISSKAKSYKCNQCTFETSRIWALRRHLTSHKRAPRIYKCDLCAYETPRNANLVTHKKIHEIAAMRTDYKATMCLF